MRDVLAKMRECGKYVKMRDFPHDCGMVDTYEYRTVVRPALGYGAETWTLKKAQEISNRSQK